MTCYIFVYIGVSDGLIFIRGFAEHFKTKASVHEHLFSQLI